MQGCNATERLEDWDEFEELQEELERRDLQTLNRWAMQRWRRRLYHDLHVKDADS